MPIIALANPKGGSGKTVTSLILATELAEAGFRVSLLDADPLQWSARWKKLAGEIDNIEVLENVHESEVGQKAQEEQRRSHFVIIDLEGTANAGFKNAARVADLVLIPVKECPLTAAGARETATMLRRLMKEEGRRIEMRVLYTMTNPMIETRDLKEARTEIAQAKIPALTNGLADRPAYKGFFRYGKTLRQLPKARYRSLEQAIKNARRVTVEVTKVLKEIRDRKRQSTRKGEAA